MQLNHRHVLFCQQHVRAKRTALAGATRGESQHGQKTAVVSNGHDDAFLRIPYVPAKAHGRALFRPKVPAKNGYKKRAEKPAFLDRLNPLYSSPERNRLVEATEFTKLIQWTNFVNFES